MSVVRVLFLGTPEFAIPSLNALLEDDHFEVVGVVTQPDRPAGRNRKLTPSPVKVFALEKGLKVISPEKVKTPEVMAEISDFGADAAVVVAFGQILTQEFLDLFTYGAVNVHSSILPRWRGAAPMQRALMAGDTETGVTLQHIVLELDAGDVLGIRRVSVSSEMNAVELHDQLKELARDLIKVDFMDYIRGNLVGEPQDVSKVTYAKKIDKGEAEIDWNKSARTIHNQVRGLAMGPQAWTLRGDKKLKILRSRVAAGSASGAPGEILAVRPDALIVGCGQGALEVLEVQPESKAQMKIDAYMRGYPTSKGDRFGKAK